MICRIDHDRARSLAGRVRDHLPLVFWVDLIDRNSRDVIALVERGGIHQVGIAEAASIELRKLHGLERSRRNIGAIATYPVARTSGEAGGGAARRGIARSTRRLSFDIGFLLGR